ncbi:MAG TPA: type IV pili twitching motility protein PilT, partial [Flexistipes sinusarabici]|nr:type IV pili twitching motility protein PilT [Flexistipes sinusarabici]
MSDRHLSSGCKPMVRKHGELEEIKYQQLSDEILRPLLYEIISEEQKKKFEKTKDLDFAYEVPGKARFRANYFMQK